MSWPAASPTPGTDGTRAAPIKLLKFVSAFAIGGTERHVVTLGKGLDPGLFDLSFGCHKLGGEFLGEIDRCRTPVAEYRIQSLYPHRALKEQIRFARDLKRGGIQIVHAYNMYANVFAIPAARLARTPVVVASIRDTGIYLTPAQRRVQKLVCRMADCVLVNAEAVRRWLEAQGYAPDKVAVIRNGVDLSRFTALSRGAEVRRQLDLPAGAPLVAVFARLDANKGIEYFLEAAAIVAARNREVRFLVIGDRRYVKDGVVLADASGRQELEDHAHRLGLDGRVLFTGFRLDVPDLLSELAVSVLPSLSEGLPNAVLESMAAGVPVVATRVGGTPEAIEDGVSGLLVPPRDAASLGRAIEALLTKPDLARRLAQAARRRIEEKFSMARMIGETQDLYADLLESAMARKTRGRAPA